MKNLISLAVLLCTLISFAQEKNVKIIDKGDFTEATYFYDNGNVQQEGTFNNAGKLHGTWTSYNDKGEKISVGTFNNGKKVGKWFFWSNNELIREVDYEQSKIININEFNSKSNIVVF